VVAHIDRDIRENAFCKIVADFRYEVILQPIGKTIVEGNLIVGREVPNDQQEGSHFVAFKSLEHPEHVTFWGNRQLYALWDGELHDFNRS
jgi:hypothetical protein